MKKFDRLPPEERKLEIQNAALGLFLEKGFAATTMENIVERVSLSKGGVYRLYSSTDAILGDLMLRGMHLRNAYYRQQAEQEKGKPLTLLFLTRIIADSLLMHEEFSRLYVEFLWEKQRNSGLSALYEKICRQSEEEAVALIETYGAEEILLSDPHKLPLLTEIMNGAVLCMHTLHLKDAFIRNRELLYTVVAQLLDNIIE